MQYDVIGVNGFDSDRKRMSVIVRKLPNGKPILIAKGADSSMAPLLRPCGHNTGIEGKESYGNGGNGDKGGKGGSGGVTTGGGVWGGGKGAVVVEGGKLTVEHEDDLERFASCGLRTLVVAQRMLSEAQAAAWVQLTTEAKQSLHGREQLLQEAATSVETNLKFVGITAIEDKLQVRRGEEGERRRGGKGENVMFALLCVCCSVCAVACVLSPLL